MTSPRCVHLLVRRLCTSTYPLGQLANSTPVTSFSSWALIAQQKRAALAAHGPWRQQEVEWSARALPTNKLQAATAARQPLFHSSQKLLSRRVRQATCLLEIRLASNQLLAARLINLRAKTYVARRGGTRVDANESRVPLGDWIALQAAAH